MPFFSKSTLSALNPRLVYCSVTGFGQTGPRTAEPGYDFIVQGIGGLMSITGERDDLPGGGPQKVGVALAQSSCPVRPWNTCVQRRCCVNTPMKFSNASWGSTMHSLPS